MARVPPKATCKSQEYKTFQELVSRKMKCPQPLEGELGFAARVCPRDRKRRDLDNLFKSVLEKNGAFGDDRQITQIGATMNKCRKCPFAHECDVFETQEKDGQEEATRVGRRAPPGDGAQPPASRPLTRGPKWIQTP